MEVIMAVAFTKFSFWSLEIEFHLLLLEIRYCVSNRIKICSENTPPGSDKFSIIRILYYVDYKVLLRTNIGPTNYISN